MQAASWPGLTRHRSLSVMRDRCETAYAAVRVGRRVRPEAGVVMTPGMIAVNLVWIYRCVLEYGMLRSTETQVFSDGVAGKNIAAR
jgi:hypothetical protein